MLSNADRVNRINDSNCASNYSNSGDLPDHSPNTSVNWENSDPAPVDLTQGLLPVEIALWPTQSPLFNDQFVGASDLSLSVIQGGRTLDTSKSIIRQFKAFIETNFAGHNSTPAVVKELTTNRNTLTRRLHDNVKPVPYYEYIVCNGCTSLSLSGNDVKKPTSDPLHMDDPYKYLSSGLSDLTQFGPVPITSTVQKSVSSKSGTTYYFCDSTVQSKSNPCLDIQKTADTNNTGSPAIQWPKSVFINDITSLLGQYCNCLIKNQLVHKLVEPSMIALQEKLQKLRRSYIMNPNDILIPIIFYSDGFLWNKSNSLEHSFLYPLLFTDFVSQSTTQDSNPTLIEKDGLPVRQQAVKLTDDAHLLRLAVGNFSFTQKSARDIMNIVDFHLRVLFKRGLKIGEYTFRPFLFSVIGDAPALASCAGSPGLNSNIDSCVVCDIEQKTFRRQEIVNGVSQPPFVTNLYKDNLFSTLSYQKQNPVEFFTTNFVGEQSIPKDIWIPIAVPDVMHTCANVSNVFYGHIFSDPFIKSQISRLLDITRIPQVWKNDYHRDTRLGKHSSVSVHRVMSILPQLVRYIIDQGKFKLPECMTANKEYLKFKARTPTVSCQRLFVRIADTLSLIFGLLHVWDSLRYLFLLKSLVTSFRNDTIELFGNTAFFLPVHQIHHFGELSYNLSQVMLFACWALERQVRKYNHLRDISVKPHRSIVKQLALPTCVDIFNATPSSFNPISSTKVFGKLARNHMFVIAQPTDFWFKFRVFKILKFVTINKASHARYAEFELIPTNEKKVMSKLDIPSISERYVIMGLLNVTLGDLITRTDSEPQELPVSKPPADKWAPVSLIGDRLVPFWNRADYFDVITRTHSTPSVRTKRSHPQPSARNKNPSRAFGSMEWHTISSDDESESEDD